MLDRALSILKTNAKVALAAIAATAAVTGGTTLAVQTAGSSTTSPDKPAVSEERAPAEQSTLKGDNRSETGAEHSANKPEGEPGEGAQGVHGACVSAVAKSTAAEGRAHGEAVSEAAHTCPKPSDDADDASDQQATGAANGTSHASPTGVEHGSAGQARGQANRDAAGEKSGR